MTIVFKIRRSTPQDAENMLRAHYSAVHNTAKTDYPKAVLNMCSKPIGAQRISAYRAKMQTDKSIISFVADGDSSQILGKLPGTFRRSDGCVVPRAIDCTQLPGANGHRLATLIA